MLPIDALKVGREMLMMVIYLGAPIILAGMIMGLLVSIITTVTQIQEQSLAFVFKMVASIGAFFFAGPWMLNKIITFSRYFLSNLDKYTR